MKTGKQIWIISSVIMIAVMALNACAPASTPTVNPPSSAAEATKPAEPQQTAPTQAVTTSTEKQKLFVYVTHHPLGTDVMMLDAVEGLKQVAAEHNAIAKVYESEDLTTAEENVRAAIAEGADIIVVLFFDMVEMISRIAPEAPNVKFLYIDQCPAGPPSNVYCAVFKEYQASFLIGAEAGLLTKKNQLGAISAIDIPFLHRYTDAFKAGAEYVNPKVKLETLWVGGDNPFNDPARGKEMGLTLAARGADYIFAAAAESNFGIFEAAQEKKFNTFGVNYNECPVAPGYVVDNLLKLTSNVVRFSINKILDGTHPPSLEYGIGVEGGIGLVPFDLKDPENSKCSIMDHPDVIEKVREIRQKIIDGELKIDDPMLAK